MKSCGEKTGEPGEGSRSIRVRVTAPATAPREDRDRLYAGSLAIPGEPSCPIFVSDYDALCQASSRIVAEKVPRSPKHRPLKTGKKLTEIAR